MVIISISRIFSIFFADQWKLKRTEELACHSIKPKDIEKLDKESFLFQQRINYQYSTIIYNIINSILNAHSSV